MNSNGQNTLDWALHYASLGYRVIPIKPREKRPPIAAWQDAATTNTGTIQAWWTGRYADHGIGIVTGTLDDGTRYIALDLDEHDPNTSGTATLRRHEKTHGRLPVTLAARTGSGGTHLLYKLKESHGDIGNGAGRLLGAGIDVRAINAQIVVAPTVHPNGNEYVWLEGHTPGEIEMALLPDWIADILTKQPEREKVVSSDVHNPPTTGDTTDTRAGTRFNRETNWDTLLSADGWTPHHRDADGTYYWTRPHKDVRDGLSATVNHNNNDLLTVFTTSITNLPPGTYDRFGYWTCTRYQGDFAAAARALNITQEQNVTDWINELQRQQPPTLEAANPTDDPLATWYIDFPKLWANDTSDTEWLVEPFLAKGRAHALYAGAKSGKSLLLLEIAAALATGKSTLAQPAQPPMHVLYIDYEMTGNDVRDRLEAFGYSEKDDLSHLHYVLLPSIAGLDTPEGAQAVMRAISATGSQLVIVDTTARAVEGEENDADTMRAFYRWTGVNMKSLGVTWVRADHAGKDTAKGQRGSSAKNDDVDVVWRFTKRSETSILIEATHRRMQWIPDKVELELRTIGDQIKHQLLGNEISDAALQLAQTLDRLTTDVDLSVRAARKLLKDNNIKTSTDTLRQALATRKKQQTDSQLDTWLGVPNARGTYAENSGTPDSGTPGGTPVQTASGRGGTPSVHLGTGSSGNVPHVPRSIERYGDGTPTSEHDEDPLDDLF